MARGAIRQRGNSWELRVYAGRDADGRKRWLSRSVPGAPRNKREAERVLNTMLAELEQRTAQAHDATVATLLDRWQQASAADWSPATVAAYETYIRRHILPTLGRVKVRNLRPSDLDALYGRLRSDADLAAASVVKVHTILRRALAEAVRWGWISVSPADRARPPRADRPDVEPPTPDEVKAVLDLLRKDQRKQMFLTFVHVAASTGARRGEVCALRWSDLDLDAGAVVISRSIVQGRTVGGDRMVGEKGTKTHQARRIALDERTVAVLREHRRRAVEAALRLGVPIPDDAYVFTSAEDGSVPWRPDGVTARFAKVRRKAGLEHVRLHDLRHYVATRMLASGTDVRTVAGRLGHANAATTLSVYSHFVPEVDRAAAERLAEELG